MGADTIGINLHKPVDVGVRITFLCCKMKNNPN